MALKVTTAKNIFAAGFTFDRFRFGTYQILLSPHGDRLSRVDHDTSTL